MGTFDRACFLSYVLTFLAALAQAKLLDKQFLPSTLEIDLPMSVYDTLTPTEQTVLDNGGEVLLVMNNFDLPHEVTKKASSKVRFGGRVLGRQRRGVKCRPFYWKSLRMCSI